MARFVVVPQWQGSPSTRAMALVDGAEAIAGDLPHSATERIEVPVEAGEALGTGIHRYSSLARTRDLVAAALDTADEPAILVGGDCGIAVPAVAHAAARHPNLAVVWLDAHGDLNSPETSPSGAFAGMALRAVFDSGPLTTDGAVTPDRIVLAGARELDDAERETIGAAGIRTLAVEDLADTAAVSDAVAATGADAVFIQVDLDVLDPAEITGVSSPVPFGVASQALIDAIARVRARFELAGAAITGFSPSSPPAAVEDMGTILRIIGALAR